MAQLRQDYKKFIEHDTEIITVGPEDANAFAKWWHEHEMPFIGIPDPKHDIANLYKQEVEILKGGRLPTLAVIDREGKIRLLRHSSSPGDIPSNDEILSLLDKMNKEIIPSTK